MFLINANVLDDKFCLRKADIEIEDGKIVRLEDSLPYKEEDLVVDCAGYTIVPGFVDVHVHGGAGADSSDGDAEGLRNMAKFLLTKGVTSFCPTTMTVSDAEILKALETIRSCMDDKEGAKIVGVNLEGPFISPKKKGAQGDEFIQAPDYDVFKKYYDSCGGIIKLVDIAPECDVRGDFVEKASKLCTVSIAHTDCSYDEAKAVFAAGARHLTHLYNAMPGIHHRKPGPIGAASERGDVFAELICDGQHVHESAVRMAFKLFPGRICLISDALRCCGMPDGQYTLGGQDVFLKGSIAHLADGTIAGSATNLYDCMRTAVSFGIAEEEAILSATLNPARQLGREREIGSIAVGKLADFIVCDDALNRIAVYLGGRMLQTDNVI